MIPKAVARGIPNPLHWKFPSRLRRARKAAGLSCAALSRRAGLGQYTVAAIEAGDRLPRLPAAEKLARALGLSPGLLCYGTGGGSTDDGPGRGASGLGARALQVREAQGLSARGVARAAELREGTVRAIERGGMPTLDTLEQLAVALGVPPSWLAFGEGAPRTARAPRYHPAERPGLDASCFRPGR